MKRKRSCSRRKISWMEEQDNDALELFEFCAKKSFPTTTRKIEKNSVKKLGAYYPPVIQEEIGDRTLLKSNHNKEIELAKKRKRIQEIVEKMKSEKENIPFLEGETISRKILNRRK